jgi:Zn-dependent protease with chaperone function
MPFLLLLILTPPCLQETWPAPGSGMDSPLRTACLTWTGVAAVVAAAGLWARWVRLSLARDPGRRDDWVQRYGAWRFYHLLLLAGVYGVALYVFGWGWAVQSFFGATTVPPGGEFLILAPFLAGLTLSWVCFYEIERSLHDAAVPAGTARFWTRREYLGHQARHNLALVLIPIVLLIALKSLRWLAADPRQGWGQVLTVLSVVVAAVVVAGMPWLLRLALGLKPLPEGPLRARLQTAARRLGFRCSDILLWDTRGGTANALVAGIFPVLRYVVLTDRLVAELSVDEIEAVFGHEVGHIKHRHMLYYLGFLIASIAAVWAVLAVYVLPHLSAVPSLSDRDDLAVLALVGLLAVYIFVVFGFVSRSCERQADLYGCRAVSCTRPDCRGHDTAAALPPGGGGLCPTGIRTFITALEKVCDLNGISRDRPGLLQSWQHSTPARRVWFLHRVLADPVVEVRFQRATTVVKGLLLVSLVAVILILGQLYGWKKLL